MNRLFSFVWLLVVSIGISSKAYDCDRRFLHTTPDLSLSRASDHLNKGEYQEAKIHYLCLLRSSRLRYIAYLKLGDIYKIYDHDMGMSRFCFLQALAGSHIDLVDQIYVYRQLIDIYSAWNHVFAILFYQELIELKSFQLHRIVARLPEKKLLLQHNNMTHEFSCNQLHEIIGSSLSIVSIYHSLSSLHTSVYSTHRVTSYEIFLDFLYRRNKTCQDTASLQNMRNNQYSDYLQSQGCLHRSLLPS